MAPKPLPVEALRWRCDPDALPFDTTAVVEPAVGAVGQDAAIEALRFGLRTSASGQNIFVRGLRDTGRLYLVRQLLETIQLVCKETKDCCYVHNFSQPDRPRLIKLPARTGQAFRRRVDQLADFIRDDMSTALSSKEIRARRSALAQANREELQELLNPFQESLKESGLTLVSSEAGPVVQTAIFPLVNGKPVPPEEFDQLHARNQVSDEHYTAAREGFDGFQKQLAEISDQANEIRRRHDEAMRDLNDAAIRSILKRIVRDIRRAFPQESVHTFLTELVDDVVLQKEGDVEEQEDFTHLYRVNVVSEKKGEGACPIIVEHAPTLQNLVGSIDYDFETGDGPRPSHLGIRAGSLLRADGGFLILEDRSILNEPEAWKVLTRALRSGRVETVPPGAMVAGSVPSLKPEPIDISVKVVLIGDPETYALLDAHDSDFRQLFKVLADFDTMIPRDDAAVRHYAAVVSRIAAKDKLPPFDRTAVAALIEHGARIAAHNGKLTARFGRLADIAGEAAFIAVDDQRELVLGDDVRAAVDRGKQRANLPSRRFRELVANGTIRVESQGAVVGQINGLATMHAGQMIYGFPKRITATIGPGMEGVINIEREAALSGAIHTKGFYIVGGLLRFLLRTDHPLAFDASVTFEQSYGGIDGDSASGAEVCCLLSALTDIPLRQDIAMTGAVDQMGHILAIGAVNEKIEGFFDVCNDLGLSRSQGVLIPRANVGDLMLRQDIVDACAAGTFHIYAAERIHEALELLTGVPAGVRRSNGRYPARSVLGIAVARARAYWLKSSRTSLAGR